MGIFDNITESTHVYPNWIDKSTKGNGINKLCPIIMRTTILILLLVSTNIICGQKDTAKVKWYDKDIHLFKWLIPDSIINSKVCVKIAPLSILGIYTGPSIRAGIEYKIKDNWSLYNELGYFFLTTQGALTKLELKHYLTNSSENVGNYISGELYYKYQQYQATDSIGKIDLSNLQATKYEKNYSVNKHVECLTIKYGKMTVYKFGIVIDAFVGLGIRLRQGENTLTKDENEHIMHSSDYGPNVITNRAGFKVFPNLDAGVKIGYRIK